MTSIGVQMKAWCESGVAGWNRFWFAARTPYTLAVIRICTGVMLAYVHLVWWVRSSDFLGDRAWIDQDAVRLLHTNDWAWSYLWYVDNPWFLSTHQCLLVVASCFMAIGLLTRFVVPVVWFLNLMVCHRLTLSLFGLDQVLVMLSMYLIVSNCGDVWSVDAWRKKLRPADWSWQGMVANNVCTRLIQIHLCVIYLFGGLSKLRGEMWFDGSALWFAIANYEYQSLDLTFLGRFPLLIASLTAVTIFWETFYCALVWPRWTRPVVLAMAVLVHGGIAIGLGMITFGLIMIVANLAFIDPEIVLRLVERGPGRQTAA